MTRPNTDPTNPYRAGQTNALNAERAIHQARAEQMLDTIVRNQE